MIGEKSILSEIRIIVFFYCYGDFFMKSFKKIMIAAALLAILTLANNTLAMQVGQDETEESLSGAFQMALWLGDFEFAKECLVTQQCLDNADVINHLNQDGITPLMEAVIRGDATVVNFLLQQPGIDLEAQDKEGNTVLELANAAGKKRIAQLLIAAGASTVNINASKSRADRRCKDGRKRRAHHSAHAQQSAHSKKMYTQKPEFAHQLDDAFARVHEQQEQNHQADMQAFMCENCTFINEAGGDMCAACGEPRVG
jgi:Ankyrin repeats (3 copies)